MKRGIRNSHARNEFRVRRARRGSRLGRDMEARVNRLLKRMRAEGELEDCRYNRPWSEDDRDGKDFTASKIVGGTLIVCSFGITISHKSWQEAVKRYPSVPQWWLPINTNDETIRRKARELFKEGSGPKAVGKQG